ncbi:MAG: transcription elongation factor GreA [bacterium]|nr:transcription elongation factor GreA [bacterium]MDZ4285980.1 transcription elongation factor GreA [Candidatus Sungbacteria bacterium]
MPEYISAEGLEKLKQDLHNLKTARRQDIAVRLEHAKSLGDLSENAEYQETKEEQTLLERQISELEEMIRNAVVIKAERPLDVVTVGSTVVVDSGRGPETYKIVGSEEAKPAEGKVSNESPLGKAFLNKRIGNVVEVKTPGGTIEYKILEIK